LHLPIVYQDEHLVAINKPHGLLVHRTRIANDATHFALQILRDQLQQKVYPTHRLDRKTAGTLLFAKSAEIQKLINQQFREKQVFKKYLAIVRGYIDDDGIIDYALINEKGKSQKAITTFKLIEKTEVKISLGKHATSRYSLVELRPQTGRHHQLRKHMAHIFHPIIGDRPHGCNKQNKLFKEHFNSMTMFLHAYKIKIIHPVLNKEIEFKSEISQEFELMLKELEFKYCIL